MKAAVYARKSNDDNDKSEENKSIQRQIENSKQFAISKGWTVDPEHIYIDDGISGGEYQNRPGFLRLLNNLKNFDALIMSESSRLGRDMTRNSYFLTEIIESDVRVWYYLSGEQESADTPEAKMMLTLKSYASEVERQKASQRSRDALQKKHARGYNTGGKVYGYDNVLVYSTSVNGEKVKSHTDYRINPEEADIIKRMFTMYLDGHGHTIIAKALNGDPRYQKYSIQYFDGKTPSSPSKGSGSWAPTTIYGMLRNERYIGQIPWGEHRKVWKRGTKKREKQAETLHTTREDLRILEPGLWEKVQKRIQAVREIYIRDNNGNLWGKPDASRASQYLLSGLVRCGCCGGNMLATSVTSGSPGNRWKDLRYQCSYNNRRGESVCSNRLKPKMKEMDALVLDAIRDRVLNAKAINYAVMKAMEQIAILQQEQPEKGESLKAELHSIQKEQNNLISIIASGGAPKTILQEIKRREARIEAIKKELAHYTTSPGELDFKRIEKDLVGRLERFQELIDSNIPAARQVLRKLFKEPLKLIPESGGYHLEGESQVGLLFPQANVTLASPTGFEPVSPP